MVARMEDLVRDALRRALVDPGWMAALDDPQTRWPVPIAACTACRGSTVSGAVPLRCAKCGREV